MNALITHAGASNVGKKIDARWIGSQATTTYVAAPCKHYGASILRRSYPTSFVKEPVI
jgi:hypothetical protein